MNITIQQGIIIEYNSIIHKGKIQLINGEINGEIFQFSSTIFQSSCPTRFPYLGEDIIATFDDDRLISIRTDSEKRKSYYNLAFKPVNVTNHPFPQNAFRE